MTDSEHARLQIYAVEASSPTGVICIVRCVGGIARAGQIFGVESATDAAGVGLGHVVLDRIDRYGRHVDFFDPPHSARVALSGGGVAALSKGVVISSESRAPSVTWRRAR